MNSALIPLLIVAIAAVSAKHIEPSWPYIELQSIEDMATPAASESDDSQEAQKRLIEFKRFVEFKRDIENDLSDLDLYITRILNLKKMAKSHQAAKRPSIISGTRSIHGTRSFN